MASVKQYLNDMMRCSQEGLVSTGEHNSISGGAHCVEKISNKLDQLCLKVNEMSCPVNASQDEWGAFKSRLKTLHNITLAGGIHRGKLMCIKRHLANILEDFKLYDLEELEFVSPFKKNAELIKMNLLKLPEDAQLQFVTNLKTLLSHFPLSGPDLNIHDVKSKMRAILATNLDDVVMSSLINSIIAELPSSIQGIEMCIIDLVKLIPDPITDLHSLSSTGVDTVISTLSERTPELNVKMDLQLDTNQYQLEQATDLGQSEAVLAPLDLKQDDDVSQDPDPMTVSLTVQYQNSDLRFPEVSGETVFSHIEIDHVNEFLFNMEDQICRRFVPRKAKMHSSAVNAIKKDIVELLETVREKLLMGEDVCINLHSLDANGDHRALLLSIIDFLSRRGEVSKEVIESSGAQRETRFQSLQQLLCDAVEYGAGKEDALVSICEIEAEVADLKRDLNVFDQCPDLKSVNRILNDAAKIEVHIFEKIFDSNGDWGKDALKMMCMAYAAEYQHLEERIKLMETVIGDSDECREKKVAAAHLAKIKGDFMSLHALCRDIVTSRDVKSFVKCEKTLLSCIGRISTKCHSIFTNNVSGSKKRTWKEEKLHQLSERRHEKYCELRAGGDSKIWERRDFIRTVQST